MFDIRWICNNPDEFDAGLAKRNCAPHAQALVELDHERKKSQQAAQEIQSKRNLLSKQIGEAKAKNIDVSELLEEVSASKKAQIDAELRLTGIEKKIRQVLSGLPNLPHDDVPVGLDEKDNVELLKSGEPKSFDFEPKEHFNLGENTNFMDFETARKMSGSRFVVLRGPLARLERALSNFMLNLHTQIHEYEEINPPALVNDETMFGTGQLPKFGDDLFRTEDGYWLIPTAEVPLTNLVANKILDKVALPYRFTAMTWCFRAEAGAAGKDTRGMIRQHQFSKVELVSITTPDQSESELERMTRCAEEVLKQLELPYRKVILSTGDLGFSAKKTYDLEVWLPGQKSYREISSCSNCGDFQARRMKARWKDTATKEMGYVHTLNGSGLAVGRAMIAILENYQQSDGSILIPRVLQPLMGGMQIIMPSGEVS